jgi:predicted RNA-binding Zn-ribbon protein involved in translation (DUF1610 family)
MVNDMTAKERIKSLLFKLKYKVIRIGSNMILIDRFVREKRYECPNCGWQYDKKVDYECHVDICVHDSKSFDEP